jgi:F-type H+-transporting ATPase subunit a
MMRFSSIHMKERKNLVFSTIQPIRRLTRVPIHYPPHLGEQDFGVFVLLRIDSYLYITGRNLGSAEALSDFRCRLLGDRVHNAGSWKSVLDDIDAHGVANCMGPDIQEIYNTMINAGLPGVGGPASPLDQFSIHPIMDLHMGNFYFSFTNPSLSMLLTLGLVLFLLIVVTKKGGGKSVPNAWQSLVELIYDFVPNLVNEQIGGISGNVKQKYFPCISVTFTFSLFRNPQGMIPFSFTVTSHFLITLALSFSIFIGITIVGFQRHGLHFFSFLLPAGVPLPLAPFLVLLELISHCFRALSSGIRLFANMMAGHSSVKILSGFAWTMLFLNNIFYFIGDLGPLFIVLALTGLELGVAISQAHVSTISICIYLNDATNLHQNE